MTKRLLPLLIILFSIQLSVPAQIHKANRLFARYDYSKAIPFFDKEISKNNKHKYEAMQRLADCYRLTGNSADAAIWYGKLVEIPGIDPTNFYFYGQSLRSIGNSKLAQEQFRKFAALKPLDPRGNKFVDIIDQTDKWNSIPNQYNVANAGKLNSVFSEFCPVFFKEGIVFTSDRRNNGEFDKTYGWTGADYLNIFYADASLQSDTSFIFSDPRLYSGKVNEPFHDGPVSFDKKGSLIFFTRSVKNRGEIDSSRFYTNRLKLFSSQFDGNKWAEIIPFPYNSEDYSVGHPALSGDGNTLIFVSDMPGGLGGTDLYMCKREKQSWSKPLNLGTTLNTSGNEVFPILNNDSILYYSSDGLPGLGGLDIFRINITTKGSPKPENLHSPINSSSDDFGVLFNKNETGGLFSSNRSGGKGEDDLYMVRKVQQQDSLRFAGFVKDKVTMLPLAGAKVFAWNSRTHMVKVMLTDAKGYYSTYVHKGDKLTVKSMLKGYAPDMLSSAIENESRKTIIIAPRDLLLSQYKVNQVFRLENIYYNFDKWDIRDDASIELDKVIAFLSENPPIQIELSAHTDSRGSDKYNDKLSERRAESAVDYIIAHGILKSRISSKGYGESMLVNKCSICTPADHQANRRTEIKITGIQETNAKPSEEPLDKYKDGETLDIKLFSTTFFELFKPVVAVEQLQSFSESLQKPVMQNVATGKAHGSAIEGSVAPVSGETLYKVQLMATRTQLEGKEYFSKLLRDMPGIKIEETEEGDGMYHYNTGAFRDVDQARKLERTIKHSGWKSCFISTYIGGKRI